MLDDEVLRKVDIDSLLIWVNKYKTGNTMDRPICAANLVLFELLAKKVTTLC